MARRKGEAALDAWSFVHLAAGLALGLTGLGWIWAVALIAGFEGLEAVLRRIRTDGKGLFEYESWPNVITDIIIGIGGYFISFLASPWHWPLA